MTCTQVDLAIDRTETVRWLISSYPHGSSYGSSYDRVLSAADGRLLELLRLKRVRNCPPRVTAFGPEMDDGALLAEVESVQAKLDAGSGSKKLLLDRKTQLLDGLRLVPASGSKP
jgi:hypothetical protein